MASVKVAVRVRPFNQREKDMEARLIVQMEGKKTRLMTVKNSKEQNDGTREKYKDFTFDHSYWSYDHNDEHYASQEQVFSDLGEDVIESAFEGYNACVFAYGQTGSGKTFTMMGSPDCQGLIPRICRQLFSRMAAGKESGASYRTEVSYLEIYNERVKDLLANDAGHSLRVREHPKLGPYVQDLSKHLVTDYDDIQECMHRGNLHRTTASTQMNDVSSRSHAIFTISFVQASYLPHNNMPSETVSKVHLVDLAGSERADSTGATGQRLVEGAHINKSLVTLGSVISALAEASNQGEGRTPKSGRKAVFIPYRDSVLTWLLKDSLGGNSKTIMIAAISPADCNYGETLSTLRYANRAKNIINKPTINEDPNVKLIRELREEIEKLRAQVSVNTSTVETSPSVLATLRCKEAQEKVLTERWTEKWRETQQILHEQKALGLRKSGKGVVLDSDMPHLVGIDDNLLSTGVTLYHLKEGDTVIGTESHDPLPDIVLSGAGVMPLHCRVTFREGVATIQPNAGAQCWLNTVLIDKPTKLSQGCILLLGRTNMFRYNDPFEAAKLRQLGAPTNLSRLSLLSFSASELNEELEIDPKSEQIEIQRAELEKERQMFLQQQEERQKELLQAQKKLDEDREAMYRAYSAHMETNGVNQRELANHKEIRARNECIEREECRIAALKKLIEDKKIELDEYMQSQVQVLVDNGHTEFSNKLSSIECLNRLLDECDPIAKENLLKHRDDLQELESELEQRLASISSHRKALLRLHNCLDQSEKDQSVDHINGNLSDKMMRSKSELMLRTPSVDNLSEPLSADESGFNRNKNSLTLPVTSTPARKVSNLDPSSDSSPSTPTEQKPVELSRGKAKVDDSDEMSSTEDYNKPRLIDGQSSSSMDRSPDERHHRSKYRRRSGENRVGRRVSEAEALRAMQRLCQRIASQKMLVISSLENDCSKEELNRQIAVLQELQKKYVRLEMALQYSFFDVQRKREVPTIQERHDDNGNQRGFRDPLINRMKESELEASDNVSTSNDELHSEGTWSDYNEDNIRRRMINDAAMTIPRGLTHPFDFEHIVSIPTWVVRGAGASTHHEYEVRVQLPGEAWSVLRRYRRFREMYLSMRAHYGDKVSRIPFPPRQLFAAERVARSRRASLEQFLRRLLGVCATDVKCPFYDKPLTKDTLVAFAPFFRKGVFESGKCGTG